MAERNDIETLLQEQEVFEPPAEFVAQTLVPDYELYDERSMQDVEAYWERVAEGFDWERAGRRCSTELPRAKWFVGARGNITANCLDRHLRSERKNKAALDLARRGRAGAHLHLRHAAPPGVQAGQRAEGASASARATASSIYMPLTPEGIMAMLACARIGADPQRHLRRAGRGARARPHPGRAGEGGDLLPTSATAAARWCPASRSSTRRCAGDAGNRARRRRTGARAPRRRCGDGEVDFGELVSRGAADCPPESMDSEDWLFILYTSGSTGKPKGCAYVHGGYMVGATTSWTLLCDMHDDDIYWCTSRHRLDRRPLDHGVRAAGARAPPSSFARAPPTTRTPASSGRLVERYGVTKMFTAPTALRMFMRLGEEWPRRHDLSSLKLLACAGEPLNPEALRWAHAHIMQGARPGARQLVADGDGGAGDRHHAVDAGQGGQGRQAASRLPGRGAGRRRQPGAAQHRRPALHARPVRRRCFAPSGARRERYEEYFRRIPGCTSPATSPPTTRMATSPFSAAPMTSSTSPATASAPPTSSRRWSATPPSARRR